jgi:hypothetical protein
VKQGNKQLTKLKDRSTTMVFIGYEPGSKAWRFYNPVTRCIHVSRDTVFNEDCAWRWNEEDVGDDEPFRMEYVVAGSMQLGAGNVAGPHSPPTSPLTPTGGEPVSACDVAAHTSPISEVPGVVMFVSPPASTPDVDEYAYSAPLRFRYLADLMGSVQRHNGADIQLREELLATIGDGPATADEALKSKDWRAAMVDELVSMKEKKT